MRPFLATFVLVVAAVGAAVGLSARAAAGTDCGTAIGTFPTVPHKRPISTPPPPWRLLVTRVAPHRFRFEWWFRSLPAQCRPAWIVLRVFGPTSPPGFGPRPLEVTGLTGVYVMKVPAFFTVTSASATSF